MRALRPVLAVSFLLGAALAAPSGAAAPAALPSQPRVVLASGHVGPLASYLPAAPRVEDVGRAVLLRQADQLVRAGVPRSAVTAAAVAAGVADESGSSSSTSVVIVVAGSGGGLTPAGDLNGNHVRDLLDMRYGPQRHGTRTAVLHVRDGRAGNVLWSRKVTMADGHLVLPMAARTGARGAHGVVLIDIAFGKSGDGVSITSVYTALDGTGTKLWTHRDSGSMEFADNGFKVTHLPSLIGTMRATDNADDLAITLTDGTEDGSSSNTKVTVLKVRGTNGATTRLGPTADSSSGTAYVTVVPDLSGDRLADLAIAIPGGRVEARAGTTGSAVWSSSDLTLYNGAYAEPAGRLVPSAAGKPDVADLAVATGAPPAPMLTDIGLPVPDAVAPDPHGKVALVDGAGGRTVWSKSGDYPYAAKRAGAAGAPALVVQTADFREDVDTVTTTLGLAGYEAGGASLYTTSHSLSIPKSMDPEAFNYGFALAFPFGDVEPDGSVDGDAVLFATSGDAFVFKTVLFTGRDGAALKRPGATPLYGSTAGQGAEVVDLRVQRGVTITVRRALDGVRRFSRTLPGTSSAKHADAYAARLRGGRCDDVLVTAADDKRMVSFVLAPDGRTRWQIGHANEDVRPGKVIRAAATAAGCG